MKMMQLLYLLLIICFPSYATGYSYDHFSNVHVLTVNPNEHRIIPVRAIGEEISRQTVAALVQDHGAIAAVNGGFWKLDGRPAGALKINHQWLGAPVKPRGAIGWSQNFQKVIINIVPVSDYTTSEEWSECEHIVGGTPILIRDGHVIEDFSPEQTLESFLVNKHHRTAVGIRENGEWVFVVVDAPGMTMNELAKFMLDLNCISALNLDGGSSSTMIIEGSVVNSGKYETPVAVSDAILIF